MISTVSILLTASIAALPAAPDMDTTPVASLAIQTGGRVAAMDTFARQTVKAVTGREWFQGRSPVAMMLAWAAQPQQWGEQPIVSLDYEPLKAVLDLPMKQRHFSFDQLANHAEFKRLTGRAEMKHTHGQPLTIIEERTVDLVNRLRLFEGVTDGTAWTIVPTTEGDDALWRAPTDTAALPAAQARAVRTAFNSMLDAYRSGDTAALREACTSLAAACRAVNPEVYPPSDRLGLEVHYNHFHPFGWAAIILVAGAVAFAFSLWARGAWLYWGSVGLLGVGFVLETYGIYLRTVVSERLPLANMYESLVTMGWGIAVAAIVFEVVYRSRILGLVACVLGAVVLALADRLPIDASIQPLMAVLRDTVWLTIHVVVIMLSYSALVLAMGLGHVLLGVCAFAPQKRDTHERLHLLIAWVMDIGILLLGAGIIFGAIWANSAWGRYWGWDPKETWSLITFVGYLVLIHAVRFSGRWRTLVTAIGAILGFILVLMTYYGVNYVLATGLHSYGFGSGGGQWLVLTLVLLDLSLVGAGTAIAVSRAPGTTQARAQIHETA